MLRILLYRKIRQAVDRRCLEHGVVLWYVKSSYASILKGISTDYPNLGRDQAADAVIGLRGLAEGSACLENQSHELLSRERSRLRINRKSKFGCTVRAVGGLEPIDRRKKDKSAERWTSSRD